MNTTMKSLSLSSYYYQIYIFHHENQNSHHKFHHLRSNPPSKSYYHHYPHKNYKDPPQNLTPIDKLITKITLSPSKGTNSPPNIITTIVNIDFSSPPPSIPASLPPLTNKSIIVFYFLNLIINFINHQQIRREKSNIMKMVKLNKH
uniref:Putative ovule protein n=1 Tax=Solanum chacoense TaxID=4108 RepID=A0A0V0H2N7_SOLCH